MGVVPSKCLSTESGTRKCSDAKLFQDIFNTIITYFIHLDITTHHARDDGTFNNDNNNYHRDRHHTALNVKFKEQ